MKTTLFERQKNYESIYDYKIQNRLPILIRLNGKNFTKLTRKLSKPYSSEICKIMAESMLYCISEFQGSVFGYTFSDEVNFILFNNQSVDTEPWFENRIQKMNSVAASTFTLAFYKNQLALDLDLDLIGDAIFDCRVFPVPDVTEAVNYLINRQSIAYKQAVTNAGFSELYKKFLSEDKVEELFFQKSIDERKELLLKYCGINFDEYYPSYYYQGIGLYKVPNIINKGDEVITRYKWQLDWELPSFIDNKDFIYNILISGKDIFRT